MWVSSWEKMNVNECANRFEHHAYEGCYYMGDWFMRTYPGISDRVVTYDQVCWIVRNIVRGLDDRDHATLPDVLQYITVDDVRMQLRNAGLDGENMPDDMWLEMFIETIIPCFLKRNKNYVVDIDADESLPARLYRDNKFALLKGEACAYSRDHKGWRLYKGIYVGPTYYYSRMSTPGHYDISWKNTYRAMRPDDLDTVLCAGNLYDIRSKVNGYIAEHGA